MIENYKRVQEAFYSLHQLQIDFGDIARLLILTKPGDPRLIPITRQVTHWLLENYTRLVVYVNHDLRPYFIGDCAEPSGATDLFRSLANPPTPMTQEGAKEGKEKEKEGEGREDTLHRVVTRLRFWDEDISKKKPVDLVVTLGGDGTVLYASHLWQRHVPPIMPFHLGSLGFLTVLDFAHHQKLLSQVLGHKSVHVSLRMRMHCVISRPTEKGLAALERLGDEMHLEERVKFSANSRAGGYWSHQGEWQVLNEVVVDRGANGSLVQIDIYADDMYLTTFLADGLVVATSTGSTAYSLSAGGSLVHPEKNSILITPICPHNLTCRPIILPGTKRLRICVPPGARNSAWASFDGKHRTELRQGDYVVVTASNFPLLTVCRSEQSSDWFRSLRGVLHWNERSTPKPMGGMYWKDLDDSRRYGEDGLTNGRRG
ncbi:MAG: ATP-NAD kinase-like domain-containing protein [Piptocephalis tieghemiana]|nr:MAG: ATP-NAD kinase-like domain-containing protein [Piptocephalis tieghemiana]